MSDSGEEAPYNGEPEYSINTEAAEGLGFRFSILKDWIYDLLDYYIKEVENQELMERENNCTYIKFGRELSGSHSNVRKVI